jgi:hypothetical protein
MVLPGVFARSRPALARYDVSPHMVKWWKAQRPDDGQVRITRISSGGVGQPILAT